MKNWQTTIAGVAVVIAALALIKTKGPTTENIAMLATGAGLLVAKDHNVTGA